MSQRNYNEEYVDNDQRKYSYDFDTIVRDFFLERVSSDISAGGHTLEIGAYKGDMTSQILGYVDDIEVVEPASELANHLRGRFEGILVHEQQIENFETDRHFDNIFLVHTLEHLERPVEALRKVKSLLTRDGKLFVMVPNANALSRQIAVQMGLISHNSVVTDGERLHGHYRTYTVDVFLRDLRESGLVAEKYGGVIVKPFANFQFDAAIAAGIVGIDFIRGCDRLARIHPDLSSSLFAVCGLEP